MRPVANPKSKSQIRRGGIQNPNSLPAILLLGPTAGGKTALAIELAKRIPGGGECISADSMQVYRGMDIGTAKPTPAQRAEVPHHLLDIVEPSDDSFSVDRWLKLCDAAMRDIRSRGKTPIVVGGTNLYVQMLLSGVDDVPPPDPALRECLGALSPEELRARLQSVDPEAAKRIHLNDHKRTIRAIEVFEQTGRPLSVMQTQWEQNQGATQSGEQRIFIVGLEYPVEIINRHINARVKAMIDGGLVDEVRRLHDSKTLGRNAREALGYKQIIEFLDGRCAPEEAIEQIKIRTRRFAKQQRTWLRRFRAWPQSAWLDAANTSMQSLADTALAAIDDYLREPTSRTDMQESSAFDLDQSAP